MKYSYAFLLGMLLQGCVNSSASVFSSGQESYPKNWPDFVHHGNGAANCQGVNGVFSSAGESNSSLNERYANPVFGQIFFDLEDIADASNVFRVEVDILEMKLKFEVFNADNVLLSSGHSLNYSECEDGWIVVNSFVSGGSGDSPVKSTMAVVKYGVAIDGSLIVHSHKEATWRRHLIGSETRTSDIWYRFAKIGR